MSLPPNLVVDSDQLTAWARSRAPDDRERLLQKIADLCALDPEVVESRASDLLQDVLTTLLTEAERDIRRRLAERLAGEAWVPQGLVTLLALDDIEIARPVIAASPVLRDRDLVRVLVEAGVEHQIEVARRPKIGASVVDAILIRSDPAVLAALAGNVSAEVDETAMQRMVGLARRVAAMRQPLSRHPALTQALAEQLYAWVGETLRVQLAARFAVAPGALDGAFDAAVAGAVAGSPSNSPVAAMDEREDMERRLIAKLSMSGQLRPAFLLRALRERRESLFIQGLSAMSGFSPADLRMAIRSDRPELLAYACVAVGLDRSVFGTILEGVRALNGGFPHEHPESRRRLQAALHVRSPEMARAALRQALAPPLAAAV